MGQLIIKDDMSRSSAEGNDCQRFNGEYGTWCKTCYWVGFELRS